MVAKIPIRACNKGTESITMLVLIYGHIGIFIVLLFHSGEQGDFDLSNIGWVRGESVVLIEIRKIDSINIGRHYFPCVPYGIKSFQSFRSIVESIGKLFITARIDGTIPVRIQRKGDYRMIGRVIHVADEVVRGEKVRHKTDIIGD